MKKQKSFTRFIAGILSFFMCITMISMPVYADNNETRLMASVGIQETDVVLDFSAVAETQDNGWYKQKISDGSATFERQVLSAILSIILSAAPGIAQDAAENIANYILDNHYVAAYYTKYLNSQVVDSCTQRYYYSYDWYSDAARTNYIGTTDTGIQTVNLCRR